MATTNLMPDDRRSLTTRLSVVQYLVAAAFAALAVGFWVYQIAEHQKFRDMAENNRLRKLPLPAPRGVLFDRNGKVLVENQNTMNIALVREQTPNVPQVLRTLAAATGAVEAPAALAAGDGLLDELHALTTNRTPATNAGSRR